VNKRCTRCGAPARIRSDPCEACNKPGDDDKDPSRVAWECTECNASWCDPRDENEQSRR
jgi:hypothetical protein